MKRDNRLTGVIVTVAVIGIIGAGLNLLPERQPTVISSAPTEGTPSGGVADGQGDIPVLTDKQAVVETIVEPEPRIDPAEDPKGHERQARGNELRMRFQQAVTMLHAKQYDYAVKALHRVLELAPRLPEAHVNMGFALIGLQDYEAAVDFFDSAIALHPMQLNAYYGLGVAYDGLGQRRSAISAMESYAHLAKEDDPYLRKARAAVWEWSEALKLEKADESAAVVSGRDIKTKEFVTQTLTADKPEPEQESGQGGEGVTDGAN